MPPVCTDDRKTVLQDFYLATRRLLACGLVPAVSVQRSFEEAIAGFMGPQTWRPSHISRDAIAEAVSGGHKNLQRAHGVVEGRLDRHDRTLAVLTGEEKVFDDWWAFWREHDATVLITKREHASDMKFKLEDLVEIPKSTDLFVGAGFSFKFRKKVELAWLLTISPRP